MLKLLDISEICYINILKTQLIQFTERQSGWKSPSNNLQIRWKKLKKCQKVGHELSIKDKT